MGRRAMSETPITTAEITRTKFPSPFREQGEAKVYKHQIDIETHVDHSLPFGIMKRKFNSTEQVFKRQGVTDVTTTYKHCPCDFFAAVGGIVGFAPGLGAGATATGSGGGAVAGAAGGSAFSALAAYGICKLACKEETNVVMKTVTGDSVQLGLKSHSDGKKFDAA